MAAGSVRVRIGEAFGETKPAVFELCIADHIMDIDPSHFGLGDVETVCPREYFVTSGDAVEKAKILEKDLWSLAGRLRKQLYDLLVTERGVSPKRAQKLYRRRVRPTHPKGFSEYEAAIWIAAGQARKLVHNLNLAKGDDCFLETEWDDHCLLCIPKNPRE